MRKHEHSYTHLKTLIMVTYTDEELEEYLRENNLYNEDETLEMQAFYHGFKWVNEIERYLPQ